MANLFTSGLLLDLILAAVLLEAVGLWAWHRFTGRGPALADLAPTLAAGGLLLLALRAQIAGLWWGWTALALTLALLAHLLDLARRWPRHRPGDAAGHDHR